MNAVVLTGLVAMLSVSAVMIAAIVSSMVTSTSRRRANELFWELEDLLSSDRQSMENR